MPHVDVSPERKEATKKMENRVWSYKVELEHGFFIESKSTSDSSRFRVGTPERSTGRL